MLGAFASQAFAMGLGDIRLNTVLNQPLNADIELLSPTAGELAELRVALASPEAYNRAGVERAFFHTKLRFEVVKRPDGTAVIRVTSREPVREPYLNFLLEATWGSGQVLREYTMLVDPPALMPAPRQMTQAPAVAAPAPAPRAAATAPDTATRPSGRAGDEYRTSRSDTLWKIASEVRPDGGVSMEQTMLGLLEANPDAFYDQNINNLKAGYVLRVPTREEMAAVGQGEALAEVRRQNRLWREGRTVETAAAEEQAAPPPATDGGAAAAAEPDAQLKLVVPETGEAGNGAGTGANVDELRKELTLAVEAVEAQRQQNQELNTRLQDLEAQIAQLHRLIELKDSEMAQLSGTAVPGAAPAAADAEAAPAGEAPAEAALPETGEPGAELAAESTDTPADDTAAAMPSEEAAPETAEAAVEPAAEAVAEPTVMPEPMPAPETAGVEPATEAAAPEQPPADLVSTLLANPMFKWAAGGAALLIALLAWMGLRRRNADAGGFQESILAERQPTAPAAPAAVAVAAGAVAAEPAASETPAAAPVKDSTQSDSSLFTDFAVSDMGAIQNDAEADPVAEADVYLAYGRYQQAEELIRGALARTPQRSELRVKLLEVLFAARNANGFDAEAEALMASLGGQDDATWQRVREMGRELSPANPLYSAEGAVPAAPAPAEDNAMDFATDLAEESAGALDLPESASAAEDNSLDFDMGELASFSAQPESAAPDLPMDEDLGFDLSGAAEAEDAGEGVLASADEVATKLDLARAYIEMGDPDGARSILDEVMQEGNADQKSEAQSLLKQIA
ncbi:MAG: FimV/HubP family polar landmark protein [Gammaproteobacteria bacterium]